MFYYSTGIFTEAGIPYDYVRYATLGTGAINVAMTVVAVRYVLDIDHGHKTATSLHLNMTRRGVTRALIGGGGGGCIFIYSCSARRISFEFLCF